MAVMWRVYIDYTSNSTCIHATCIREYQCQLWKNILRLGVLQWSLIQAATVCKHLTLTISRPYICNSTRRDQIKNQRTAQFPESSNQTAANQKKVRCSPTAFERRIYVLTVTLRKTSFPTRGVETQERKAKEFHLGGGQQGKARELKKPESETNSHMRE